MTFYLPGRRRPGYVPGRDPMVDEVMRGWQQKYCTFSEVSICISTFNVNGKSPPRMLNGWFPEESIADLYAVGLQEMDLSVGTYIIDNTRKMEEWLTTIHSSLPGGAHNFEIVTSMRLVGIFVVLFKCKRSSVRHTNVQANFIATGINVLGSKLGNKGGTAISLKLNDSLVCFVNCHLAAGNGELERRNQDYRDISQLQFLNNNLLIHDHDVVFWFGDLNYRINTDDMGWSGEDVRQIASSSKFHDLVKFDQLREQQAAGRVFVGFQEPPVLNFRPTYKYDPGTSVWDSSEKARAPAWCDRILWWSRDDDLAIKQHLYESVNEISISDHKPVRSVFTMVVKNVDQKKADALHEEAIREADRRANELLPQVKLSETEVDFGEVQFLQPVCRTITITNVGKSTVRFKFMVRPQESVSASWLQVTPPHYVIPIGQSTQISLTVTIDQKVAYGLSDTETSLQDILVMNLENGRDHFIPVTAKHRPRCFGVSLERLLANKAKKTVNLIDFDDGFGTDTTDNSPQNVPREIYRLVTALHARGAQSLHFDSDNANGSAHFFAVRTAIEEDMPKDIASLHVPTFAIYNTLLKLLDTLKEPVIPYSRQQDFKIACSDPGKLWALVSNLHPVNAAVLEYLIRCLTELVRAKRMADDVLSSWADVLFRDRQQQQGQYQSLLSTDPRAIALRSLCAYSKDVSICHSYSTPRLAP